MSQFSTTKEYTLGNVPGKRFAYLGQIENTPGVIQHRFIFKDQDKNELDIEHLENLTNIYIFDQSNLQNIQEYKAPVNEPAAAQA